jgi:hypothetical protein
MPMDSPIAPGPSHFPAGQLRHLIRLFTERYRSGNRRYIGTSGATKHTGLNGLSGNCAGSSTSTISVWRAAAARSTPTCLVIEMHVEVLNLARGPVSMTAIFHILWPILTMNLSSFAARSLLSGTGDHLLTRLFN